MEDLSAPSLIGPSGNPEWEVANWRRRLLAAFIDLLLLIPLHVLLSGLISFVLPGMESRFVDLRFILIVVFEAFAQFVRPWSPGCHILGIRALDPNRAAIGPTTAGTWFTFVVNPEIKKRESWFTLLTGTYILFEGSRIIVRWAAWKPPMPLFGIQTNRAVSTTVMISFGLILCLVSYLIFRLRREAVRIGLACSCAILLSTMLSWNQIGAWAEEEVRQRRSFQGIPVEARELELAHAYEAQFIVVGACMLAALIWLVRWHLILWPPAGAEATRSTGVGGGALGRGVPD